MSCRKADAHRTMADASNAAAHAGDAGKAKAAEAADVAQDYSRQAGDKVANTYANAKDNAQKVSTISLSHSGFGFVLFPVVRKSEDPLPVEVQSRHRACVRSSSFPFSFSSRVVCSQLRCVRDLTGSS